MTTSPDDRAEVVRQRHEHGDDAGRAPAPGRGESWPGPSVAWSGSRQARRPDGDADAKQAGPAWPPWSCRCRCAKRHIAAGPQARRSDSTCASSRRTSRGSRWAPRMASTPRHAERLASGQQTPLPQCSDLRGIARMMRCHSVRLRRPQLRPTRLPQRQAQHQHRRSASTCRIAMVPVAPRPAMAVHPDAHSP